MSLEVGEETLLFLQQNQGDFLLELVTAVPWCVFSGLDLLQRFSFVHLRLEKENFHFLWEISPLSH